MRSAKSWILLAVLLALVFPFVVQAGGKGAVRANMYEASVYTVWANHPNEPPILRQRTLGDGDGVGFVIFLPTVDDTMKIAIKLKDGPPNATLDVNVFPSSFDMGGGATLTTDAKGRGSLKLELDIPDPMVAAGLARVKVVLVGADDTYATDVRDPPFVNPPDNWNPGSTAHLITLK